MEVHKCVACDTPTICSFGLMGSAKWYIAVLMTLGIEEVVAEKMIEMHLEDSGQSAGNMRVLLWTCMQCLAHTPFRARLDGMVNCYPEPILPGATPEAIAIVDEAHLPAVETRSNGGTLEP